MKVCGHCKHWSPRYIDKTGNHGICSAPLPVWARQEPDVMTHERLASESAEGCRLFELRDGPIQEQAESCRIIQDNSHLELHLYTQNGTWQLHFVDFPSLFRLYANLSKAFKNPVDSCVIYALEDLQIGAEGDAAFAAPSSDECECVLGIRSKKYWYAIPISDEAAFIKLMFELGQELEQYSAELTDTFKRLVNEIA